MSCSSVLSGNITLDCDNPIVGGYSGEAVIVDLSYNPTIVYDSANPRKIKSITCPTGGVHIVENAFVTPFNGSTTAGNTDNGLNEYLKTVSFQIPMRGADTSRDKVEPFFNSTFGFLAVLPKRDRVGDGSFEVVGAKGALRGDITTLTRDENANGGMWGLSLTCREPFAEVDLTGDDGTYESAKTAYDNLKAQVQVGSVTMAVAEKKKKLKFSVTLASGFDSIIVRENDLDGSPIRQKTYAVNEEEQSIEAEGVEITVYGAITWFDCSKNPLTTLDVSKNVALTYLNCAGNLLTTLDVSKNVALTYLNCLSNLLTTLDVSKNVALTYLRCYDNRLTTIDVSKNVALYSLELKGNQLTSLDLSKNVALTYLSCILNPTVTTLSIASSYSDASVSTALATLITDATSTTGTLNIYGGDNTTVHTAATTKGWTVNTNL